VRSSRPDFEQFLEKVHRRFIALRLLEHTALGLLAGCAAGLPLVIIAIWRPVSAVPLAGGATVLGALAGLIYGLLHRPTLVDTAGESDRQLFTSDLLTTALSMRRSVDPWAGAVLATANRWARTAEPSSVLLNRLGARAWGGIGLATALLAVLTLLPAYASPIQAADHAPVETRAGESAKQPAFASSANRRRTMPGQQPEDLRPSRETVDQSSTRPSHTAGAVGDKPNSNSASDPAQGRGESHTVTRSQNGPAPSEPTLARNTSPDGRSADGAGQSARSAVPGNFSRSQSTGVAPALAPAPWKSTQWAQQAEQALHAADSGQLPGTYRDVIHGYFERR
jgi:hypothetical protein